MRKTHRRDALRPRWTLCGLHDWPAEFVTDDPELVTCRSCNPWLGSPAPTPGEEEGMLKSRTARAIAAVLVIAAAMGAGAGIALAATTTAHRVFVEYKTRYGPLFVGYKCPRKPVMTNHGYTATYGRGVTANRCTKI